MEKKAVKIEGKKQGVRLKGKETGGVSTDRSRASKEAGGSRSEMQKRNKFSLQPCVPGQMHLISPSIALLL